MGRVISQEKIQEINEVYFVTRTYSGTAQKVGVSPATVKKYLIPNYEPKASVNQKKIIFDKEIKPFNDKMFIDEIYWGNLCIMQKDEYEEIKELWKEIVV